MTGTSNGKNFVAKQRQGSCSCRLSETWFKICFNRNELKGKCRHLQLPSLPDPRYVKSVGCIWLV